MIGDDGLLQKVEIYNPVERNYVCTCTLTMYKLMVSCTVVVNNYGFIKLVYCFKTSKRRTRLTPCSMSSFTKCPFVQNGSC